MGCAVAGWSGAQVYSTSIDTAALKAYQEVHEQKLIELSALPPVLNRIQYDLESVKEDVNGIENQLVIVVKHSDEMISDHTTRIAVLEAQTEEKE